MRGRRRAKVKHPVQSSYHLKSHVCLFYQKNKEKKGREKKEKERIERRR